MNLRHKRRLATVLSWTAQIQFPVLLLGGGYLWPHWVWYIAGASMLLFLVLALIASFGLQTGDDPES